MFLNLQIHDYDKDIFPFIKNGIIIDTSVFKIFIDGIVCTRISKKKSSEFEDILLFLDCIKMNNRWEKFFVTPHVLTEICTHLRNDYNKWNNYKEIIKEIFPILTEIEEKTVTKGEIMRLIDFNNPIVEIGDISIFVIANDFISKHAKIAILANDNELNRKYKYSNDIMLLDYKSNLINFL